MFPTAQGHHRLLLVGTQNGHMTIGGMKAAASAWAPVDRCSAQA
jgi:hypothetical protein